MMKAVLFDMDGVLYDSMPNHVRAWHETILSLGVESHREDYYLLEGATGKYTINHIFQREYGRDATDEEVERIYAHKANLFTEINDSVSIMPGAAEVLETVKRRGCKIVVVTGSGQPTLFDNLQTNYPGIFRRELMVTAYDVKHGKPNPEPYLLGLEKAGVTAREATVVENAPLGVQAAVAAGIDTLAVNTGPLDDSVLLNAGARIVFPSMFEVAKFLGH
jgi:HAD superfamily hydrolase (TIGR01509 family)